MKKLLFVLLSLVSISYGSPSLICDPVPAPVAPALDARPSSYIVTIPGATGSPFTVPATINADSSHQLIFNLGASPGAALAYGIYQNVTATASNSAGTSAPSSPPTTFSLPLAVTPGAPANLRLSPQ